MPRIVYSCPFVPAEWVTAHGFTPSRVLPSAVAESRVGACPFAQAFVHAAARSSADVVIFTTTCDQMRRASETFPQVSRTPTFVLHVPTSCAAAGARALYGDELQRLGRFLERLGGQPPTPDALTEIIRWFDTERKRLRAARSGLGARRFSEALLPSLRSRLEALVETVKGRRQA